MEKINNNLQKYRVWKQLTQLELSKLLKISVNQIRQIEIDKKYPKYQIRARICKFFNVSQNQMFYYGEG